MNKSKLSLWIGGAAILVIALLISIRSVKGAEGMSGDSRIFTFSIGGNAKLRNTIELSMSEVNSLQIEYGSKNIYVYPSSEDKVVIKEYLVSDAPEALATVDKLGDGKVLVRGSQANNFVLFGLFLGGERIEVYIPETGIEAFSLQAGSGNIASEVSYSNAEGSLSVQTGSGNIKWSNAMAKELSFQAGSGNVRLNGITGDVEVQTGSGNIACDKITGEIKASAGSGNITIDEFCGSGSVSAGSGNVKIEADNITGDIKTETGSGNNRLTIPEGLPFRFEAQTGSGNISTDFDDTLTYNKKGNQAQGSIGTDPAFTVSMRATSGNVRVVID